MATASEQLNTLVETVQDLVEIVGVSREVLDSAVPAAQDAEKARNASKEWANNSENTPVSIDAGGDGSTTFSAKHWAIKVANLLSSALIKFSGNVNGKGLFLTPNSDNRIEIIKDTLPLDYTNTKAGFIYQYRDTENLSANSLRPSVVFQNTFTGNGSVVPESDFSNSIWWGVLSTANKTGDGSGHSWTAVGELGAYGSGKYNELGMYQGEATNIGSLHGTISGVEMLLKDSPNEGLLSFDTKMYAVAGRVARFNAGSRMTTAFLASSEGTKEVDSVLKVNPVGTQYFKNGIDLRNGNYSGYTFRSNNFTVDPIGNTTALNFKSGAPSGLSFDAGYKIESHTFNWGVNVGRLNGTFYIHDAVNNKFPLQIEPNTPDNTLKMNPTGIGFFGANPVAKPKNVPVTAEGIHAALVSLGLIQS